VQRFGGYFARKGWFGFDKSGARNTAEGEGGDGSHSQAMTAEKRVEDVQNKGWNVNEGGSRILVEVGTAYAITKVLLPARVILSVWATPWFARNVLGMLRGVFGKSGKVKASAAAGTSTPGAGVRGKGT